MSSSHDIASQHSRILNANPLNYQFFDNPAKNLNARAYLESYKIALKASGDQPFASELFQEAWNERHNGKGDNFNIKLDDITSSLGNAEKSVSKSKYHSDRASHSGPLGRVFYKATQGISWLATKILPQKLYSKSVDVSADRLNSEKQGTYNNLIEKLSDKKFQLFKKPVKILGKERFIRTPMGSVLSVIGLACSLAACAIMVAATFGAGLPLAVVVLSTVLSFTGAALGLVGGEVMSHHDRNKSNRDTEKLLGDTCDISKQAKKENNQEIVTSTHQIAKELITQTIDNAVDLHQNGRKITNREWLIFGVKAMAGATVPAVDIMATTAIPAADIISGTVGTMIKTTSALTTLGANTASVGIQRYNHQQEVKETHAEKRHVAYNILDLNSKLKTPLRCKLREEDPGLENDTHALEYKTVKWAKEYIPLAASGTTSKAPSPKNIEPAPKSKTTFVEMISKPKEPGEELGRSR